MNLYDTSGTDLAALARQLLDACGPFPGDSWLHELAATGMPPQPRTLEPLIPDPWGLALLDSVREHHRHAEQLSTHLTLSYLFQEPRDGDTVRIIRPDRDGGQEPHRTSSGVFRTGTQDSVAARIAECLVPGKSMMLPDRQDPPERIDPYELLSEAQAAVSQAPPRPRTPVKIRASQWARLRARDTLRAHGVSDGPHSRAAEQILAGTPVEVIDDEPLPPIRVYDLGDREHEGPMATILREQRQQLRRLTPTDVTKIIPQTVTTTGSTDPDGTLRVSTITEYRLRHVTLDEPEHPRTRTNTPGTPTGHPTPDNHVPGHRTPQEPAGRPPAETPDSRTLEGDTQHPDTTDARGGSR